MSSLGDRAHFAGRNPKMCEVRLFSVLDRVVSYAFRIKSARACLESDCNAVSRSTCSPR